MHNGVVVFLEVDALAQTVRRYQDAHRFLRQREHYLLTLFAVALVPRYRLDLQSWMLLLQGALDMLCDVIGGLNEATVDDGTVALGQQVRNGLSGLTDFRVSNRASEGVRTP